RYPERDPVPIAAPRGPRALVTDRCRSRRRVQIAQRLARAKWAVELDAPQPPARPLPDLLHALAATWSRNPPERSRTASKEAASSTAPNAQAVKPWVAAMHPIAVACTHMPVAMSHLRPIRSDHAPVKSCPTPQTAGYSAARTPMRPTDSPAVCVKNSGKIPQA